MSLLGRLPRGWRILVLSAGLIAVLAGAGLGLMLLLAAQLRARLPRQITVERVRISPLTLVLTADGLRIADRKGSPLFSCRQLSVDFQILSLFSREIFLRDVSLREPTARVVISPEGTLNLTDLLALAPSSPASRAPQSPSRELRIQRLSILGARVDFSDLSRTPSFATRAGPLWLDLEEFRTRRDSRNRFSFSGSTDSGERFWWLGDFSTVPFRSIGEFSLQGLRLPKYTPYYGNRVSVDVRQGTLSARAHYVFDASPSSRKLAVEKASLRLRGFEAAEPGHTETAVRVPTLDVEGIHLDLVGGSTRIGAISTRGGSLLCRREVDGRVNLDRMFSPRGGEKPAEKRDGGSLAVGRIVFEDYRVLFEDVSTPRPVRLDLSKIRAGLANFSDAPDHLSDFDLEAVWEGRGRVSARGPVSPLSRRGTLKVHAQELALGPLAPYLERVLRVRLVSADLSGEGQMDFVAEPPDFRFRGDVQFGRFAVVGIPREDELLGWSSLSGSSLEFAFPRRVFSVRTITLTSPRLRWAVDSDGTSRWMRALEPPEAAVVARAEEVAAPAPAGTGPEKPFRIRIGEFRVTGGRAAFLDASTEPNVRTSLTDFTGVVRGVSSEKTSRASVDLRGRIGGGGPIAITGQLNPLARETDTDIKIECRGVDLPPFGSYSGKYLGYRIRKGKLALDLKYRIEHRQLEASNLITMDQFFLGEKTTTPSATKLPVKLAVALLRDRNGRILLDVPVSGDLDDPKFRFGRVIVRVLGNILTKIATSPFTLLSKAFGGGGGEEELQYQEFSPGSAELGEAARHKLDALARALSERSDLTLEIGSGLDEASDRPALERQKLDRLVWERKQAASSGRGSSSASAEKGTVEREEYPQYLQQVFLAAFPQEAPQAGSAKAKKKQKADAAEPPRPIEEMERRLLEKDPVTADDLDRLAAKRRGSVRDYLLQAGIGAERLFLTDESPSSAASSAPGGQGPRVLLGLGTGPD